MSLKLNRDKTHVVQMAKSGESLDFLGFTFRYDRDLKGRNWHYLNVFPSKGYQAAEGQSPAQNRQWV